MASNVTWGVNATGADLDALARTAYGEARGEPLGGIVAVCWVAVNRLRAESWFGRSIQEVCMKKYQFSCWNEGDPNLPLLLAVTGDDAAFRRCLGAAALVLSGDLPDPSGGATHYYRDGSEVPSWAESMVPTITIGHHKFFREVV